MKLNKNSKDKHKKKQTKKHMEKQKCINWWPNFNYFWFFLCFKFLFYFNYFTTFTIRNVFHPYIEDKTCKLLLIRYIRWNSIDTNLKKRMVNYCFLCYHTINIAIVTCGKIHERLHCFERNQFLKFKKKFRATRQNHHLIGCVTNKM